MPETSVVLTIIIAALESCGVPVVRTVMRIWIRIITAPHPPVIRDRRREEFESDVFDQVKDLDGAGYGRLGVSIRLLIRFIRGIPADITWSAPVALRNVMEPVTQRLDAFPRVTSVMLGVVMSLVGGVVTLRWLDLASVAASISVTILGVSIIFVSMHRTSLRRRVGPRALVTGGPVRCASCGLPIDAPTDQPPHLREPCPRCGSRTRAISVTVSDTLTISDLAKAVVIRGGAYDPSRGFHAAASQYDGFQVQPSSPTAALTHSEDSGDVSFVPPDLL